MRTIALTVLLLILPPVTWPAHAEDAFAASEAFVVLGHSYDLAATEHCLGARTCHELNPWLARFDSPLAFTTAKIPVALVQLWLVRKLHDNHPKLATGINLATGALFTAIGARNERLTYIHR